MPDPSNPSPDWDSLAAQFAQAAIKNAREQFTKHGLLGLSDEAEAVLYGVMTNLARSTFGAAAEFQRNGFDVTTATTPGLVVKFPQPPTEPPTPIQ